MSITPSHDSYDEFPGYEGLRGFDADDRKFIAVANAHEKRPAVLQATDSEWWGYRDALRHVGVRVEFLCPDFVRTKHREKRAKGK